MSSIRSSSSPLQALTRILNKGGRVLGDAATTSFIRLDPATFLEEARRRTRLEDFGEPDLREPLSRLLASYERDAGLTLTESLETLGEKESRAESRQLIERLLATMREGRPFSAALAAQGHAFPPLYAATVRIKYSPSPVADTAQVSLLA